MDGCLDDSGTGATSDQLLGDHIADDNTVSSTAVDLSDLEEREVEARVVGQLALDLLRACSNYLASQLILFVQEDPVTFSQLAAVPLRSFLTGMTCGSTQAREVSLKVRGARLCRLNSFLFDLGALFQSIE